MTRPTIIWLISVAALCGAGAVAYASFSTTSPLQTEDGGASQECSSCTLRHQNLGKIKEARERERAELGEISENSEPDSQQQQ